MEIFKLFGSILVDSEKAEKSISKTGEKAQGLSGKLGAGIKTAGKWAAGITAAAVAVGGAMFGVAQKAAAATDRIDKMSDKIGFSRQGFQEWEYILSQNGTSIDGLKGGMKTLTNMTDDLKKGTKNASDAFGKLGIEYDDLEDKTQEEIFETVIKSLQDVEDETERAAIANDLLGRSGSELAPLLNAGSDSVEELKKKASELGLVIEDDAVDAGVKFTDTMDSLKRAFGGVMTKLGVKLMPVFQKLADWIVEHMPEIQDTFDKVFGVISDVVTTLYDIFEENVLPILKDLFSWIKDNMPTIKETFKAVFDFIFEIVEDVWGIFSDHLIPILKDLWDFISPTFPLIKTAVETAFKGVKDAVQTVVDIFDAVATAIENAVDWLTNWNNTDKDSFESSRSSWDAGIDYNDDNDETDETEGIDGSSATGLPFVPYDGYRAELHRGETVLSADSTKEMMIGMVNALAGVQGTNQSNRTPININLNLDGRSIANVLFDPLKNEAKQRGEVLV